ncbi:MAG: efflux transporter outer membrane subunit [Gammaproteobacteria bacterium]|nr:efflux transporter outer membrane subunit [Gammaproteobacteria bacterium]
MTPERYRHPKVRPVLALTLLGLALAGCSIGPRFHAPRSPTVGRYTLRRHAAATVQARGLAGHAQHFVPAMAVSARWWTGFHSPDLDRLMARGLRNSQTLKAAVARLEQARAAVAAEEGIFYPQVNGNLGASRQDSSFGPKSSGSSSGSIYSLYTGGLSVSYFPDVFGANRLVYRSAEAQAAYQRDQMLAAQLSLVGNIATTAILAASERTEVAATKSIIRSEVRLLALTRLQYRAGAVPYLAVINQESQLATSRATLPALAQQLAVSRYTLATLIGEFPSAWRPMHLRLRDLHLPTHLPVSLPSQLVRQRPDIRAALEQLRYANAAIGIADAQFYPVVQLTATFGQESLQPDKFFSPASNVWSLAGSLLAPIFHGGTLRAQRREAIAQYAGTLATYRQTVLDAFQQVASSLRALAHDAQALRDQRDAYEAARQALHLAEESYRAGAIDSLQLLTNEALYSQARIAYVRAKAQRYLDTVGLYTALGGGLGPAQSAHSQETNASQRKTQR